MFKYNHLYIIFVLSWSQTKSGWWWWLQWWGCCLIVTSSNQWAGIRQISLRLHYGQSHSSLDTVQCSLHTSTLYSEHRTLFNVHCTQLYYSLHHCGQSSLHTAHTIFAAPVCVGLILHLFAPSGDLYAMATVLVNIWVRFCRTGKMLVLCLFFSKKQSLRATRPDFLELIFQLILVKYEFWTPEKYSEDLEIFFGVPCHGHLFTIFANFWVKITVWIKPPCVYTCKNRLNMKCPSSSPLNFDDFPFF